MIIDSSALIAIANGEPDGRRCLESLRRSSSALRISSPNYYELWMVIDKKKNPALTKACETLIDQFDFEIVSFSAELAKLARDSYVRFGKGHGHRAHLNFGDCFSYVLARVLDEPLLFVGDDFNHTDVKIA